MPLSLKIFSRTADRKRLVDERVLDNQLITVGRGQACTVVLEDASKHLSRLQAEFEKTARGYLLRVTSAASPVIVNGAAYLQGSEVAVHAGDILAMPGYELEVVSVTVGKPPAGSARPSAAPASPVQPQRATGPAQVNAQSGGRTPWLVVVAGTIAGVLVLALAWPTLKGLFPEDPELRKAEQTIARLDGEARSLLKLVDNDRREVKEATAASTRAIERVEAMVRSTRTSQDRAAFDAALGEARGMAKASIGLEDKVRGRVEGPFGLPKAEGTLGAAVAAAKGGDRSEAIRLLEQTVASLAQMRLKIAEDRKTTQAELEKRREDLLTAETRALADVEARAKAEAEARARAKGKADAEAAHALETAHPAQSAQSASPSCLAKLSGAWSHPVGGTWTFAGNLGTRLVESSDYGPKSRQITVINVSSCEGDTMTFKFVRLTLLDTNDPAKAYDQTPANNPNSPIWAKVNTQRYSISGAGLRFGTYTYAKR